MGFGTGRETLGYNFNVTSAGDKNGQDLESGAGPEVLIFYRI
jgi:hypothetical protein